jgi:hypothetical protein
MENPQGIGLQDNSLFLIQRILRVWKGKSQDYLATPTELLYFFPNGHKTAIGTRAHSLIQKEVAHGMKGERWMGLNICPGGPP